MYSIKQLPEKVKHGQATPHVLSSIAYSLALGQQRTQVLSICSLGIFAHKHLMLQILLALNFPLLTGTLLPNEGNLAIVAFLPCSLLSADLTISYLSK
jgi:hypothetical protein